MERKFYLVAEKEEINGRCHRFCNPSIILGDNEKDAEAFYNYRNYTGESRAVATLVKGSDTDGTYVIVYPVSRFWAKESKTVQSLLERCIGAGGHRVRYVIGRHPA